MTTFGATDLWVSSANNVEFMATNDNGYQFIGAWASGSATLEGNSSTWVSWVSQVNASTAPASTNYVQQWIAPRWSTTADNYLNYVCQRTNTGASSQFIRDTNTNLGASMATGAPTAITSQGTAVNSASSNTLHTQTTPGTSWSCSGLRSHVASTNEATF